MFDSWCSGLWSHCPLAAGSAQPSGRFKHGAAAVSADRAYVFGGIGVHHEQLDDLWVLRCDAAANSGTASWELVAPTSEHTPSARFAATLSPVSLSDSARSVGLLLFGGCSDESLLNDVWLFDTRTAAWTMLLPYTTQAADASVRPEGRYGHSAITHTSSSEVVIFGGCTGVHYLNDVFSFSVRTRQWTLLAHTAQAADASVRPDGRGAHSAITHNSSEVVIFGGSAADRRLNDVLSFSVRTRQWTLHECAGASPSPRYGHSACRVAESMFVLGGMTNEDSLNDLWEYALDMRAWTQVVSIEGTAPSARLGHSLIAFGSRLVVFGGRNPYVANSFDSALHCFDLQRRQWSGLAVGGEHPRALRPRGDPVRRRLPRLRRARLERRVLQRHLPAARVDVIQDQIRSAFAANTDCRVTSF
jgi:hypothetical protein